MWNFGFQNQGSVMRDPIEGSERSQRRCISPKVYSHTSGLSLAGSSESFISVLLSCCPLAGGWLGPMFWGRAGWLYTVQVAVISGVRRRAGGGGMRAGRRIPSRMRVGMKVGMGAGPGSQIPGVRRRAGERAGGLGRTQPIHPSHSITPE